MKNQNQHPFGLTLQGTLKEKNLGQKMKKVKLRAICRHTSDPIDVPCNWNKNGYCGCDARKCKIVIVE